MRPFIILALTLTGCPNPSGSGSSGTTLSMKNSTGNAATVYAAFGSDSVVGVGDWIFCDKSGSLTCSFPIDAGITMAMPLTDKYTNVTLSFNNPVGCGVTKAEININNPNWYDILDVSLVDGFSTKVMISAVTDSQTTDLGPATDESSDAQLAGVYPFGCDTCVARENPPCGISKGTTGCKAGTQYDPTPPCQWQGATKGGGDLSVTVELLG